MFINDMNIKLKFEEEATDIFCFPGVKKYILRGTSKTMLYNHLEFLLGKQKFRMSARVSKANDGQPHPARWYHVC